MNITLVRFTFFVMLALAAGCLSKPSVPASTQTQTSAPKKEAIDLGTTGKIEGVIKFAGTPPIRPAIDMTMDPACALAGSGKDLSESAIVTHGMLENTFVYVKRGVENYAIAIPPPAVLDQNGCRYIPHVIGLMTGQTLRILNSDNAQHNIYADAKNNPRTNDSQGPGAAPLERTFPNPELLLPITCNQHPWMKMYLDVVSNSFFAVSDKDGRFSISGLPPGTYEIEAVHERFGSKSQPVTVKPRGTTHLDFTFSNADSQ